MGRAGDHELAERRPGASALLSALVYRGGRGGVWSGSASLALRARLQQVAGERRAVGAAGNAGPIRGATAHAVGRDASGAGAQGDAPLLPRHDSVVAADPVDGARRRLRVQHQVPAAAWRRSHLLPRQRDPVRESHSGGIRSRLDCGAIHLSGNQSRGTHALAAPVESARDASAPLVQVLGRDDSTARARAHPRVRDRRAARGERVHDGGVDLHHHDDDFRDRRSRPRLRRALPEIQYRERRADPDVVRRTGADDGVGGSDRRGDHPRGAAGLSVRGRAHVAPGSGSVGDVAWLWWRDAGLSGDDVRSDPDRGEADEGAGAVEIWSL